MAGPIADTRGNPFGYLQPLTSTGTYSPAGQVIGTPQDLIAQTTQGAVGNTANLNKISQLVNSINQSAQQQANLARVGGNPAYDAAALSAIQQRMQGYVSPETVREAEAAAAGAWGSAGFGVDTPAWQSAVRRAMGLKREDLVGKGLEEYSGYLAAHPAAEVVDVSKYTMTPQQQADVRARELQFALEQEKLMQDAVQFAAQQALKEREFNLKQDLTKYQTGLQYGFDYQGNYVPGGKYQYGYYDPQGQFHGNARKPGI